MRSVAQARPSPASAVARMRRSAAPARRRAPFAVGAAILVLAAAGAGFLLLRPEAAASDFKRVATYLTDLPGGCEQFKVTLAGSTAGDDRWPLSLVTKEVVLTLHHGLDEGVKVAEGLVPKDTHGSVDVVIAAAHCFKEGAWAPATVRDGVVSVKNGIPSDSQDNIAFAFDILLPNSVSVSTSTSVVEERVVERIEFVPRVEIHRIEVPGNSTFPIDLGELIAGLEAQVEALTDYVVRLEALTRSLVDRLCEGQEDCGLYDEVGYLLLPPGDALPALPKSGLGRPGGAPGDDASADQSSESARPTTAAPPTTPPPQPGRNSPPTVPTLPSPVQGATRVSAGSPLSWAAAMDPDGDALTYDVLIGGSVACPNVTTPTCSPTLPAGALSWSVVAKDGNGGTASSPTWSFTVNRPPSAATSRVPLGDPNHIRFDVAVTYGFDPGIDDDGDALTHRVLRSTTDPPAATDVLCDWSADATCQRMTNTPGVRYHWAVETSDGVDTVRSAVRTFRMNEAPIPAANLRVIENAVSRTLKWDRTTDPDGGPNAITYTVLYKRMDAPTGNEVCNPGPNSTDCVVVLNPGDYRWYVSSSDGVNSGFSPYQYFTV